ncbi:MAG: branched-chain amino acid transaminase [Chloroflexi bacterium]|nr:branched-chain amino acid transaminase [Chloroflexota bacterium]
MSPAHAAARTAEYVWLNGQLEPWDSATLHVSAVGASGHFNVFEGIKGYATHDGRDLNVFGLREHLRRLAESMKITRMAPPYSVDDLTAATLSLLRRNDTRVDTYIRPVAFFSGLEHADFSLQLDAVPEVLIWTRPFKTRLGTERRLSCQVSSWTRITDNQMPPRVKTMSNYQNNRLAALQARADGYDTAIMLGPDGKVSEGPGACLVILRDGVAITPPVTAGILESVTRAVILRLLGEELGIRVVERPVDRTELYVADEAFFCGTGWEILPVTSFDRMPVGDGAMGPITAQVDALYLDIVRGGRPDYSDWLTNVHGASVGAAVGQNGR